MAERKKCRTCLEDRAFSNYYKSYSSWDGDGYLPVCKSCLRSHIKGREDDTRVAKEIMRIVDKPFIKILWDQSMADKKETLGTYFKNVNLNSKDDNYDDSDIDSPPKQTYLTSKQTEEKTFDDKAPDIDFTEEEVEELIEFWGRGFSQSEYEFLTNEYTKLINSYESDDSYAMQMLFQEASHQRLTIKRKRERSESVDKELKTLQDLLGSANIKPMQETGANATDQASFGTLIKKYENDRPIPEPSPEWADVDGISKYIKIWFLGHLCKMLGIKNEYSAEYDKEMSKYTVEAPVEEDEAGDLD